MLSDSSRTILVYNAFHGIRACLAVYVVAVPLVLDSGSASWPLALLIAVAAIAAIGQWGMSGGGLGAAAIKTAAAKTALDPLQCIVSGILCNMLVCLAVWFATSARDAAGRLLGCFFPIMLFVVSGFEHSIANIYYIPAGIIAKGTAQYADAAMASGVTQAQMDGLTWGGFAVNLSLVTVGNVIGGAVLVAGVYWFCYMRKALLAKAAPPRKQR